MYHDYLKMYHSHIPYLHINKFSVFTQEQWSNDIYLKSSIVIFAVSSKRVMNIVANLE